MSLNLSGIVDNYTIEAVTNLVKSRFKTPAMFKTPESLILHEQKYIDDDELLRLCSEQYEETLEEPRGSYVVTEIKLLFKDTNIIPMTFNSFTKEITAIYLPEYDYDKTFKIQFYTVKLVPTTLHHYIKHYTRVFGDFPELLPIPGKAALDLIFKEAIRRKAPDLTIASREESIIVYYNIKKKREDSNNIFSNRLMDEIIMALTIKNPIADKGANIAKYIGIDIDHEYRGRVVINKTYHGFAITIRLFSKFAFQQSYQDLNLNLEFIKFLEDTSKSNVNGIRWIVGETMSGKNTTALAILKNVVETGYSKVVSIEMPIEQTIDGIEQINADTHTEYMSNIRSLIHQNPDFVYVAETKDETGLDVMKIGNTGKKVLSTLHANSCGGTLSRLIDITGLNINRVLEVTHSITYQELRRVRLKSKETGEEYIDVRPYNLFVYFDDKFKEELFDRDFGYILKRIKEEEKGGFCDELLSS